MSKDELQDRVCRCCGRDYKYPVPKSLATRFYCDACVALDDNARAMFEHFNKRLKALSREIASLKSATSRTEKPE